MSGAPSQMPMWPPDYSSYTSFEDQEVLNVLREEANNRNAPESYKEFLAKLSQVVAELQLEVSNADNRCEEYKKRFEKSTRECDTYAEYLATAKENYDLLFKILQEERLQRIDLEKKTGDLEEKIEELKQEQLTRRSVPPPSTPPHPPPSSISVSTSSQQPLVPTPAIQHPTPPQQLLPANLHEECQRKMQHYSEKARELERQAKRLASSRQNMEEQLMAQYIRANAADTKAGQLEQQNAQLNEQLRSYVQAFQQYNGQLPAMGAFQSSQSQQRHSRPQTSNAATMFITVPGQDSNIPVSLHDPQRSRAVYDPSQQHQQ